MDLLAELRLALLDGGHPAAENGSAASLVFCVLPSPWIVGLSNAHMIGSRFGVRVRVFSKSEVYVHHVTDTTSRQSVQAGTDTLDGDDVQVSCAGVVCAVHDGTAVRIGQLP